MKRKHEELESKDVDQKTGREKRHFPTVKQEQAPTSPETNSDEPLLAVEKQHQTDTEQTTNDSRPPSPLPSPDALQQCMSTCTHEELLLHHNPPYKSASAVPFHMNMCPPFWEHIPHLNPAAISQMSTACQKLTCNKATGLRLRHYELQKLLRRRCSLKNHEENYRNTYLCPKPDGDDDDDGEDVLSFESQSDSGKTLVEVFRNITLEQLRPEGAPTVAFKDCEVLGLSYKKIEAGVNYVALDRNLKVLLVVFPDAFERCYAGELSKKAIAQMTANIELLATYHKPSNTSNQQNYEEWTHDPTHAHFCMGNHNYSRCGVHRFTPEAASSSTAHNPLNLPLLPEDPSTFAQRQQLISRFLQGCGETTQVLSLCLKVISKELHQEMVAAYVDLDLRPSIHKFFTTVEPEVFSMRVLEVNTFTEPRYDVCCWENGVTMMTPFGEYVDGDVCVDVVGRRVPLAPGGVLGVRGRKLQYWCLPWRGRRRYCLTHSVNAETRAPSEAVVY